MSTPTFSMATGLVRARRDGTPGLVIEVDKTGRQALNTASYADAQWLHGEIGVYLDNNKPTPGPTPSPSPSPSPTPSGVVVVNAAPTGVPAPSGGWKVAFADGFAQLDRTLWFPNSGTGGATGDSHGDNSNDIVVFNPSQVLIESDGVHLRCQPTTGRAQPFVSGYLQTLAGNGMASKGFGVLPDLETTWAFEIVTKFPYSPMGGGSDQSFWMTDARWTVEIDLFEIWLWPTGYTSMTDITWIYNTGSMSSNQSYVQPVHAAVTDQKFHRWTWLFDQNARRVTPYIDGVKVGNGIAYPASWQQQYMHLIHEYCLREHAPDFTTGSRDQVTRSIAAYYSGPNPKFTGGGIAAGTSVK